MRLAFGLVGLGAFVGLYGGWETAFFVANHADPEHFRTADNYMNVVAFAFAVCASVALAGGWLYLRWRKPTP